MCWLPRSKKYGDERSYLGVNSSSAECSPWSYFYTRIAIKYSKEEIASNDQKCIFSLLLDALSFNRMR